MKKEVSITTSSFAADDLTPLCLLRRNKLKVVLNPYHRKLKPEETIRICRGAVGIIAGTEQIDADVLGSLPYLKVISRCGVGMENIDLNAAEKLKIKVYNTPDAPTRAVSELAVGLMLSLLRNTHVMSTSLKNGIWEKHMGSLLFQKTIGIIGLGRIGKSVAQMLDSFGCNVLYFDPFVNFKFPYAKKVSLSSLLSCSDIISIHAAMNATIIGRKEIKVMKNGSWIVNTSRGKALDEKALYSALKSGKLCGAALDVFEKEPYSGKLAKLSNVILTPHIGSYAKEARIQMELQATENLIKGLKGI